MIKRHKISVVRKGSLCDRVNNLFGNRGESLEICGRDYILREKGDFTREDPVRTKIVHGVMNILRRSPLNYVTKLTQVLELGYGNDNPKDKPFKFRAVFSIAEELPSNPEHIGEDSYVILQGVRYVMHREGVDKDSQRLTNFAISHARNMLKDQLDTDNIPFSGLQVTYDDNYGFTQSIS